MSEIIVKTENSISESTWNDMNWGKLQGHVCRVQYQIYKARKNGDIDRVHSLQKLLINSKAAKLVATHRVTTLNN